MRGDDTATETHPHRLTLPVAADSATAAALTAVSPHRRQGSQR